MLKEKSPVKQNSIFGRLEDLINLKHPMCQLTLRIAWQEFEKEFEQLYCKNFGRPAKPIRLMVALLILKQMHNLSDEEVVETWIENPYWQYFSGEEYFKWQLPCEPTELTKFRKRIGEKGVEKIFEVSIKIHGQAALEREVIPDTTVQEKNITFPTDTKLHLKIIGKCLNISKKNDIKLRQSYKRTIKKLRWTTRYLRNPRRKKEARKAIAKIKTIAGRLVREIERKLSKEQLAALMKEIEIMKQVLEQKKDSKNKIYSLHEPQVSCIAKGKEHKKYEFGSKASILMTKTKGIIVGAKSFQGAPYDGNTLEPTLEQAERIRGVPAEKAIVDEGYRGRVKINDTEVIRVHQPKLNKHSKYKWKKWFRRRAAVEGVISHLKNDFGLDRNYLKGDVGDSINLMMSASAFNFKMLLNELAFILRFLNFAFDCLFYILNFRFS